MNGIARIEAVAATLHIKIYSAISVSNLSAINFYVDSFLNIFNKQIHRKIKIGRIKYWDLLILILDLPYFIRSQFKPLRLALRMSFPYLYCSTIRFPLPSLHVQFVHQEQQACQ